jgi:hypothetical protein
VRVARRCLALRPILPSWRWRRRGSTTGGNRAIYGALKRFHKHVIGLFTLRREEKKDSITIITISDVVRIDREKNREGTMLGLLSRGPH